MFKVDIIEKVRAVLVVVVIKRQTTRQLWFLALKQTWRESDGD